MLIRFLLFILFFGFIYSTKALSIQNDTSHSIFEFGDYYFKDVNADQILQRGAISSFIEDNDGFIWIAGSDGLLRYDGYDYKAFKHDENDTNSLSGNRVNTMWKGHDGLIYIGTNANGLSVFNTKTEKFINYKHNSKKPNSLAGNSIRAIIGDEQGGIWIGTNSGLDYFDPSLNTFTHFTHQKNDKATLNDNHVRSLLIDKNKVLWVGTWQGLNKFNHETQTFESVLSDHNQPNSFANQIIYTMFESSDGKLWLGTADKGAAWIEPTLKQKSLTINWLGIEPNNKNTISSPWVTAIKQISPTTLWISTYGGGINEVNLLSSKVTKHMLYDKFIVGSINQNEISTLFIDSSGIVWIGNWGKGVNIYNTNNAAFRTLHHSPVRDVGLSTDEVLSILELQNGQIWLGTNNNGIDVFSPTLGFLDGHRPAINQDDQLQGDGVLAMAQTVNGDVWIGTRHQGLYRYNSKTDNFKRFTPQDGIDVRGVTRLWPDNNGDLWIASDVNFYRFDSKNKQFIAQTTRDNEKFGTSVNGIRVSGDGSTWVATAQGLFVILKGTNQLLPIVDEHGDLISELNQQINSVFFDNEQNMWVNNNRDKLFKISSWTKNIINTQALKLIPNTERMTFYYRMGQNENDRLWGSEGMLDTSTLQSVKLDQANGIDLGNEYYGNIGKTKAGLLFFGGSNGLLMIKPELYRDWDHEPNVVITKLKIDGKSLESQPKKSLKLPAKTKSISFEFASLDYSAPHKLQYAYQLEGYDDKWLETDAKQRSTQYTNLPPGDYTFKVKSTNRIGKWSDKQVALSFTQEPAWHQTIWFKILVLLTIFLGFYMVLKLRLHHLHLQKVALQKKVIHKTADILMLSEVGKELTASHVKQEVGTKLYKSLCKIMPVDAFLLGIIEEKSNSIYFPTVIEEGIFIESFNFTITNEERLAVQCVINAQEYILMSDADIDNYHFTVKVKPLTDNKMSSVIYEPLIIKNKTVGVLSVQSKNEHAFTSTNIEMLRTLASYTAVAMDNILAYEQIADKNEALNKAIENLEKVTYTDQLTGAHNRRFLDKYLDQSLVLQQRQSATATSKTNLDFGFILIDADHFKHVNDTYGHEAGDQVLCQLVAIIKTTCRQSDWVVRWGGEEFLVVCQYTERNFLTQMAERIRHNIDQHSFDLGNGKFIHNTCSLGIAPIPFSKNKNNNITWQQSLNIADIALYAAKTHGRNAWVEISLNPLKNSVLTYNELIERMQEHIDHQNILLSTSITDRQVTIKPQIT